MTLPILSGSQFSLPYSEHSRYISKVLIIHAQIHRDLYKMGNPYMSFKIRLYGEKICTVEYVRKMAEKNLKRTDL